MFLILLTKVTMLTPRASNVEMDLIDTGPVALAQFDQLLECDAAGVLGFYFFGLNV